MSDTSYTFLQGLVIGPQGVQGTQGPQGTGGTGTQGPQGAPGSAGAQGTQGPQGVIGTQGAQGPQGAAGSSSSAFAMYYAASTNGGTTSARYLAIGFVDAIVTTEAQAAQIAPFTGTLTDIWVRYAGTAPAVANVTYTVMVNGVASALALTINATGTNGHTSGGSVSVTAGDTLSIRSVSSTNENAACSTRCTLVGG